MPLPTVTAPGRAKSRTGAATVGSGARGGRTDQGRRRNPIVRPTKMRLLPLPPPARRPRPRRRRRLTQFRDLLRRQFAQDPVLDPVLVPPLARIHLHAVDLHAEMDVNAAGQPGLIRPSPSSGPSSPCRPPSRRSAACGRRWIAAVAVVQHDAVAVDPQVGGPHHAAVVGGLHRRVRSRRKDRSPGAPAGPPSCRGRCNRARRRSWPPPCPSA